MTLYRLGLTAAVATMVLGWNLSAAQAQEPGVALQRALTDNRVRSGVGEDIVRGSKADLSVESTSSQGSLVAMPSTDSAITFSEANSPSALRRLTRNLGPSSDR